ncbi:hypothetical protein H4R99_008426 [Coemansia sp. RSA 1722]|nr:hypothetical protein IWW45_002501 [Coemansia sp. RSA 485]KAJ2586542.1 hypothetical protein H4R99_008426 [Coemansia sp. RSA 1722]
MSTETTESRPAAWINSIKERIKHIYDKQNLAEWLGNPMLYAGPFPGIGMCVAFSGGRRAAGARSRRRYSTDRPLESAAEAQDRSDDIDGLDASVDDAATLLENHH